MAETERELFSVPVVKSPRLCWIERHKVKTRKADHDVGPDEEDEDGEKVWQWVAFDRKDECYGGATEDDALAAWARARGVRMWNEEGA